MSEWVVRRWARYGHERLYAETSGGTKLGYLDVKTGQYHCDDESNLPLLKEAIRAHRAEGAEVNLAVVAQPVVVDLHAPERVSVAPSEAPPVPVVVEPSPAPEPAAAQPGPPPVPEWTDLGETRAGAAARARALEERAAQGRVRHTFARLVGARTDERAWRIGADGEEAVAAQLAKLGPQWRVLHAVPVGDRGSDIDHVVIGPAGVFTVNAKHHPHTSVWVGGDTFMVNGQRVPYVRNSRHEAKRASRLLTATCGFPVHALGIIAVMGAQNGLTIKAQPEDGAVVVVWRRRISQHLSRLPGVLSAGEVDAIHEVARRSTTWRP